MTAKVCLGCGKKIPRKIPHTNKKTKSTRKYCYNCSPPYQSKHTKNSKKHKSERRRRKEILVKMLGGHCTKCGYNKSISALSFHHKNPKNKCFDISNNGCLLQDWDIVVAEAEKCKLLCLNCHAEIHND